MLQGETHYLPRRVCNESLVQKLTYWRNITVTVIYRRSDQMVRLYRGRNFRRGTGRKGSTFYQTFLHRVRVLSKYVVPRRCIEKYVQMVPESSLTWAADEGEVEEKQALTWAL